MLRAGGLAACPRLAKRLQERTGSAKDRPAPPTVPIESAMLKTFRQAKSSWFVVGFLGLVMVAFIITGVGPMGGGPQASGDWVARVDDETISAAQLSDDLSRQLNNIRQREQNSTATMADLVRSGAFDQILQQLILGKASIAFGEANGLAVPKTMVDAEIARAPPFQNVAGQFEDMRLRQWLAANNISEQQLRDDLAAGIMQRQMIPPISSAARIPQGVARDYTALLLERRTGSAGLVPTSAMAGGTEPTPSEMAAFYNRNAGRYAIPERRVLRYAVFGRPDVAAGAKATDAEIAAAYQANAGAYAPKESRTLSQVVLPNKAAADAFAAKVAGGTPFAQAAAQAGFAPSDTAIGQLTREQLASRFTPGVANAAFSAARGAVTSAVQSPLGWHVIRVDAVTTTPGRPLASVRAELAQQIEERKATNALLGLVTRIEDAIGDGASFEEVARAHGLSIQQTAPITAAGAAPGVQGYQLPAEVGALLRSGFDLGPDEDPVVETITPNQRFAVLTVANIVPAAPPPLAQIADRVSTDIKTERAAARARAVANAILTKVNAGVPMKQAFAEAGAPLPPVQPMTAQRMEIARRDTPVPAPMAAMFRTAKGKARLIAAPQGSGWFVVRTDEIVRGDAASSPGLAEATRAQLSQVVGSEFAEQFLRAVEKEVGVERNAAVINRLKADLSRTAE